MLSTSEAAILLQDSIACKGTAEVGRMAEKSGLQDSLRAEESKTDHEFLLPEATSRFVLPPTGRNSNRGDSCPTESRILELTPLNLDRPQGERTSNQNREKPGIPDKLGKELSPEERERTIGSLTTFFKNLIKPREEREPSGTKEFLNAGNKFAEELSPAERKEAHRELASLMQQLSETKGEQAVKQAVERLNENLAARKSPYVFNTAKMSNGQDFLSLRKVQKDGTPGILVGTIPFSDKRKSADQTKGQ